MHESAAGTLPLAETSASARIRASAGRRAGLIAAGLLLVSAIGVAAWFWSLTPKRFDDVVAGQLYRSGEVSAAQLEHVTRRYGIQRVLCLLNPTDPRTQAERAAAEALGLDWVNVPLPGNGASRPEDRDRIRAFVLRADATAPALVHCAAGVNRTGLAIGMYRIHHDRWTVAQVLAEMRSYGFDDEPEHENLREALRAEADLAAGAAAD